MRFTYDIWNGHEAVLLNALRPTDLKSITSTSVPTCLMVPYLPIISYTVSGLIILSNFSNSFSITPNTLSDGKKLCPVIGKST